jgi:hypothetical protein
MMRIRSRWRGIDLASLPPDSSNGRHPNLIVENAKIPGLPIGCGQFANGQSGSGVDRNSLHFALGSDGHTRATNEVSREIQATPYNDSLVR